MVTLIATQFPDPPGSVIDILNKLAIVRRGDPAEMEEASITRTNGRDNVPRPWAPSNCDDDLRKDVWAWCEKVAAWVNHEYAWRPAHMIPACWPQHPHIARELPVLAFLHWTALAATSPEALEDWHRHTLLAFHDRMAERLGDSKCESGEHAEWPAQARYHAYAGERAFADRKSAFTKDIQKADTRLRPSPDGAVIESIETSAPKPAQTAERCQQSPAR